MSFPDLPEALIDGFGVRAAHPLSGGDIARAYRLDTVDGPLFLKWRPDVTPDLFEREAAGLRALRAHRGALMVPEVLRENGSGLVLEWIESGAPSSTTEVDFGRGLAHLHGTVGDSFGSLDGALAGYLGSAEVDLTPSADWPEFFVWRRVVPLIDRGIGAGVVPREARDLMDRVEPRAAELCGPPEPPSLVHGDLWAGNRMVGTGGRNWLIDPAAYWAHREIDLAMMSLFGGFGAVCFDAYHEAFPLADGWRDRIRWYQLPPLLVHAILFGGGYGAAALSVLRQYAR
ncbi:fructosamine kinase family protein [Tsukamurella sp. 8F]|uniref:fructosamine kinase family protein n=1 Tax=unclassified Tsukamurella TaxID=2633480 RepID=UPI0023B8C1EE|nr:MULTISPECIES: fructosamine kinase family protein [unclassified Tsukamurella]MDF0530123.1 fructosamine kinase family protein [Tsukamurella sp. 8J]MDF0586441.1 fructosamine kinase family protein [Tsukamurella sp. 8F]